MGILKLDPRPPSYDSVAEASVEPREARWEVVDDVETGDWRPIPAPPVTASPAIAFVDGVQRLERRVSAEQDGAWPLPGILASYAAGAMCPGREPSLRHARVERRVILTKGARPSTVRLAAHNGDLAYLPAHTPGGDLDALYSELNSLRWALEREVVHQLIVDGEELIVADGRIPEMKQGPVMGLIKTLHDLYLTKPEHIACLMALGRGERTPVFVIERDQRRYYTWFLGLAAPGPHDLALSGIARVEVGDHHARGEAIRFAGLTAALLPGYASTPMRDSRAPQNLLPVGQLERELRHRLGDEMLLHRLMLDAFARERQEWTP